MRPTTLLMLAIGIVGANSLVLSPIAGDVARSFPGTGAADVLITSAIYAAGTALSALTLAPHADRIGLRNALVLALAVLTLGLTGSTLAPSLTSLAIAQGIAGLAAGVALPATYGLAAEVAPKGAESATLGKVLTGWTLSLVAGVTLSAMLSDALHWRAVFGGLAVISVLIVLAIRRALPQGQTASSTIRPSPLRALRIPGVGALLMSVVAYMVAFYGLYAYLGPHLTENLGLTTTVAGLAALAYGIGFGAISPLDRLIDRYGAHNAAPIAFAGLAIVYIALAASGTSAAAILLVCVLWGGANHLGINLLVGGLTALDPGQRAAIMGLYSAVTYAAMFAGTALFRPVFEAYGFTITACASALCILPALWQSIAAQRRQIGIS